MAYRHGMAEKVPEYSVWKHMRKRCNYKKDRFYHRYGGRGIKVDPRWDNFANFYKDMGPRPSVAHSLDRINNDLGYSKKNCRWATIREQANNRTIAIPKNNFARPNSSGFRGVRKLPSGKFRAVYGKTHLGVYITAKEAALIYNIEAVKKLGKLALLNDV